MTWYIDIWGYLGGTFACFRFVPQIYKAVNTKSTNDLSWGLLLMSMSSQSCTIVYSFLIESYPLIITIFTAFFMTCILSCLKYKYDKKQELSVL